MRLQRKEELKDLLKRSQGTKSEYNTVVFWSSGNWEVRSPGTTISGAYIKPIKDLPPNITKIEKDVANFYGEIIGRKHPVVKNHIREFRESRHISRSSLAAVTGIALSALRNYEAEEANPTIWVVKKLVNALDTSVEDLFDLTDDEFSTDHKVKIQNKQKLYDLLATSTTPQDLDKVVFFSNGDWMTASSNMHFQNAYVRTIRHLVTYAKNMAEERGLDFNSSIFFAINDLEKEVSEYYETTYADSK